MEEQKQVSIYKFKKGDIITRIRPMVDETGEKDYTFIGGKITFMGIANASIYISRPLDFLAMIFSGRNEQVVQLPLELWEAGWAFYMEPDFLDAEPEMDIENQLEFELEQAKLDENFEKAELIKKELIKLRKTKPDGKK